MPWRASTQVPLELSPLVLEYLQGRCASLRRRASSRPNIIRRLEEPCGVRVLGENFPAQMVDDEPKVPGYEVFANGASRPSQ